MKLIKPSFEIIEQTDYTLKGIKKFIERCSRVCYKSENNITDTSYEKFVDGLIKRGHDRCLEFGTVYLRIPQSVFGALTEDIIKAEIYNDQWVKWNLMDEDLDYILVTTNYRYVLQWIKSPYVEFDEETLNKYIAEPTKQYNKRYTVHFYISRGILDEFRTHVGLSHLAESTRWCNYSKDKFNNELTFIIPSQCNLPIGEYELSQEDDSLEGLDVYFIDDDENPLLQLPNAEKAFIRNCDDAEQNYMLSLENGWSPQQARDMLPLGIKSELISCGFTDAWKNFFMRRCAKDAHPDARDIATKLKTEFDNRKYGNS